MLKTNNNSKNVKIHEYENNSINIYIGLEQEDALYIYIYKNGNQKFELFKMTKHKSEKTEQQQKIT